MTCFAVQRLLIVLLFLTLFPGCRHRIWQQCSCIDTSLADRRLQLNCDNTSGEVSSCFEALEEVDWESTLSINPCDKSLAISLEECCCLAAVRSHLANIIDRERKAACLTIGYNKCLDRFLAGQSLQQRNRAAAAAGELFLRLVEVHLQTQLLDETRAKLAEWKAASQIAAEQGLATVDADKELDAKEIELDRRAIEARRSHLTLVNNLVQLLDLESDCIEAVEPIYELFPVFEGVDLNVEVRTALEKRPDLSSFRGNPCGGLDPECYSILSQLDPRIGIGVVSKLKKLACLQMLCDRPDPANCVRTKQFQELRTARQQLVKLEVFEAVLNVQASYQKLVLEQKDFTRLQERLQAIEAAAEMDAQGEFLESIQIWVERQEVKSKRTTTAIAYEIAKVKLLEATGEWIEICDLSPQELATCRCCDR
jgi:hypothetical protein